MDTGQEPFFCPLQHTAGELGKFKNATKANKRWHVSVASWRMC